MTINWDDAKEILREIVSNDDKLCAIYEELDDLSQENKFYFEGCLVEFESCFLCKFSRSVKFERMHCNISAKPLSDDVSAYTFKCNEFTPDLEKLYTIMRDYFIKRMKEAYRFR